ncbi:MAG: hypothetical protein DMD81_05820 [Candidatus Rokuibacteriota bacterium]|nr:MAG: hypothetical protein DMD81_05820 [Candidatus Rokubacteria bacterium]
MSLDVECVDDAGRFAALETEWNMLLAAAGETTSVFLTWEWLHGWWKHFGQDLELSILLVRERGELIAIAPFMRRERSIAGVAFDGLEFLGSGTVGSDYLDVIVQRDRRVPAVTALADWVDRVSVRLDLAQLRHGEATAAALGPALVERGWRGVEILTDVCPFISLGGQSWSSYLATLGATHRSNFRRRLRALTTKFHVTFECATTVEERELAFTQLVSLHRDRWRERGGSDGLGTPALVAFHDEMTELALTQGWLRLFVLALDGEPAASLYGLRHGDVFSFYQSGFDPRFAKLGVGLVTMGLAIQRAIEEGAREYDFLHGDERYKFLWARESRQLSRLEAYPPRARARLVAGARTAVRAAKRAARRVVRRRGIAKPRRVRQEHLG